MTTHEHAPMIDEPRTESAHVQAIKAHLQSMVILSQLDEENDSAFIEAFFSHYEDANNDADALAAQLAGYERDLKDAERQIDDEQVRRVDAERELEEAENRCQRLGDALVKEVNQNRRLNGHTPVTREQVLEYCNLIDGDLP